jgi:FAD/FMN-containing dehydrogenase
VISYQVVTADGSVLTASADENPDLYWGLRGGGGNFGVVTEFTVRLHPIDNRVLSVDLFFEPDAAGDLARAFSRLTQTVPEEATVSVWTGTAGPWEILPAERQGTDVAILGYVYVGDPARGRELLPEFRAAGQPIAEDISEMSYVELQSGSDQPMGHQMRRYWKGHYLRELPEDAIAAFVARGGSGDDGQPRANGMMQGYGGAISRVGIGDTAFSHRDARFEFITMAGWEDAAEDQHRMGAARQYASAMEPFASGVYVNGLADEGAAGVRHAYYAETLARLTALKDRYDPDNVFHLNHNIAPSGTVSHHAG